MKKLFFLSSIILCLCSCAFEGQMKENTFVINYDEDRIFDWNSIVEIEEVIPLEVNDSCLLGYADKCVFSDDKIVYSDSKQKALFVFDRKGKFLYKIDALGVGDKEYSIIKDVIMSYDKHSILILDNTSILSFDLETGTYCDRILLEQETSSSFYRFADIGGDRFYFWSTDLNHSLYIWDNGNLSAIKERQGFPFISQKFYYDDLGKLNLVSDCGQYLIETISGDSIQPKYSFDFGRWAFPADKKVRTVTEWEKLDERPYFKSLLSVFETKDILYVSTATPKRHLYCIAVQKNSFKIVSGNQDIDAPVVVVGSKGNSFYGILYPSLFMGNDHISNLIRAYGISEEGNPLIIRFKFSPDYFVDKN